MQDAETVLNVLRERGRRGLPCTELYRQLFNPSLFELAHGRIYANHGAMTPGADGETADGMSQVRTTRIIDALRHERYRFQPVKRTWIPKKNGKLRPLGLPSWSDKLVGEVIRLLLEAYYEPQFSGRSHGFRPGRGCHTALREVEDVWTGTTWFIEGDISDCFGSLDHEIMARILAEKIHDNRFLRLIRNMLEAGYLEDWEWNATLSGVPQGGVVSPILSNIYLDRLDKFAETVLMPEYTRGVTRAANPEYARLTRAISDAWRRGDRRAVRQLRAQRRGVPRGDPRDPGYRRLRYIRYADDHLLGFTGPKAGAEQIKARLAAFLHDDLKLELNEDKTLITHARTQAASFLGYQITVQHSRDRPAVNGVIRLRVPLPVITAKCAPYLQARQTRAARRADEPARQPDHQHLRRRIPGHRPVLPARQRCLAVRPAPLGCRDLAAQDAGRQAPLNRDGDGPQIPGHHHHASRAARLLPGHRRTAGQETTGHQVRWHSAETTEESGHHRPPSRPAHPPQGADHQAPDTTVRVVRHADRRGSPPGPQARRPHQGRTAAARMGATHGQDAQENPRGLHPLPPGHPLRAPYRPHGVIAGEPRAGKLARGVRTGGRWKRTRQRRAPRQRPTGVALDGGLAQVAR